MRMFIVVAIACFALPSFTSAATATWNASNVFGPRTQMIGHWTFDGPDVNWTTGVARDRSGWGNHASMIGLSTTTSPVAGKLGQAFRFKPDPVIDYVDAGSAASLDNLSNFTVSMWVKTAMNGTHVLISKSGNSYPLSLGWMLEMKIGQLQFTVETSNINLRVLTQDTIQWSDWRHVVLTWTGNLSVSDVNFYVDGKLMNKSPGSVAGTGTRGNDGAFRLVFGGIKDYLFYGFDGSIDDVRIFSRILSPQEIAILAKAGRVTVNAAPKPAPATKGNLVGHWTFDGPDVNWTTGTVLDKSGNGNNGSMIGLSTTTSPAIGKLGQAFRFDGVNDQVNAGDPASLKLNFPFSISAWTRLRASDTGGWLYAYGNQDTCDISGAYHGVGVRVEPTLFYAYFNSGVACVIGDRMRFTKGSLSLNDDKWHHVVALYENASNVRLYIDGVMQSDVTPVGSATAIGYGSGYNAIIGGRVGNNIGSLYYKGSIDDVRIYNRVLTPAEIATLYRSGTVTIKPFVCGVSTVKDADGNVYNTVKIGTQCWMKQNMRVGTMITGTTPQTNNSTIEKWCYSNTLANCMTTNNPNYPDGGLYQWDEAMQYSTTAGAQGICPAGWHIPTHDEFTTLERAVCTSGTCATDFPYNTTTTGYRGTTEGTKLKPNGISGFEGNLSGFSTVSSSGQRTFLGYFWSSSENGVNAWRRWLYSASAQVNRDTRLKSDGYPVRCLQDS